MTKATRTAKITTNENAVANDNWRPDAYINTYLKNPQTGELAKVGRTGLRLYKDRPADALLIARYTRDPELVSEMDIGPYVHSFALANSEERKAEFTEDSYFG